MSIDDLELIASKMSAGSVSIGDWEILVHFANGKDLVVELGTNVGSTAIVLAGVARLVVTVDVFESLYLIDDPEHREKYQNHFNVNQHTFSRILKKLEPYENIHVQQSLSYEFATKYPDGSVDMVFIDADHSYKGAKRDYEAWYPKVKTGGFFAFHDVGPGCPVFDLYNEELLIDYRIELVEHETVGPCWTKVFRKK